MYKCQEVTFRALSDGFEKRLPPPLIASRKSHRKPPPVPRQTRSKTAEPSSTLTSSRPSLSSQPDIATKLAPENLGSASKIVRGSLQGPLDVRNSGYLRAKVVDRRESVYNWGCKEFGNLKTY